MKSTTEPFHYREGRLQVEQLALWELAQAREGKPAWVCSRAAIGSALAGLPEPATVAVGAWGPVEVLGLAAAAGCWASVCSCHELELALGIGFPPERITAAGDVWDDGFLKDCLAAGVASIPARDEAGAANLERIAGLLGVSPPRGLDGEPGAPLPAPPDLLARVGGLLAAVLAPPPELQLDVALDGLFAAPRVTGQPLPVLCALDEGPSALGWLTGLSRHGSLARPVEVELRGTVQRGDWVLLPHAEALALRRPDPVHADPGWVLVRGALWRELDSRPLPRG